MSLVFGNEGFEGGSNGGAIGTGSTSYNGVQGPWTFANSIVHGGSLSGRMAPTGGTAVLTAALSGPVNTPFARFYVYFSSLPSALFTFAQWFTNGSGNLAELRLGPNGELQLRNTNNVQVYKSANGVLQTGQWHRIEWDYDKSGSMRLRVYATAPDGATPDLDTGSVSTTATVAPEQLKLGAINATTLTAYWDDVAVGDTANPGSTSPNETHSGSLGTSGTGTLTGGGTPKPVQTIALTGSGAVALAGAPEPTQTLDLSGSGDLTLSGTKGAAANELDVVAEGSLDFSSSPGPTTRLTFAGSGALVLLGEAHRGGPLDVASTGDLALSGVGKVFILTTPTTDVRYNLVRPPGHLYATEPLGLTVYRVAGEWRTALSTSPEEEAQADRLYRGGYLHPLNAVQQQELVDAGFGDYITLKEIT